MRERLSGNEAVAVAMRQINPDVVAAFPITPSTEIPQYFAGFVANGKVDTEFVAVESEHSAMSACIGASSAGARAMTATSSAGMALMWEMLYIAAASRNPVVMSLVNRALSGPLNIHNDHSDSMGARDSGWIQIYGETNQEAYDNFIQLVRIAEHKDVFLPAMNCFDGFITSHAVENIELLDDDVVKAFVGEFTPEHALLQKPVAFGPLVLPAHFMEAKRGQEQAMRNAKKVILEVADEFEKISGRKYGLFEEYKLDDAEIAIVVVNSTAGTAKTVVDDLRAKGVKAGLLKIRVYRPFPAEEIAGALAHVKAVAVMDKAASFNACGGPVFTDVSAAIAVMCAKEGRVPMPILSYIYGLGGRDVKAEDIAKVYSDLQSGDFDETYRWLGVRG
jgi:pyruvate ferredoxin oxidoreductase alpha subunit